VPSILVDAGPLIALQDRSERRHADVRRFIERYRGRLLTTWPVLAEVCHFLPERSQVRFLRWAAAGGLSLVELHESALATIADWKEKYRNVPMDLADASLLWAAEQTGSREILTLDLRGFAAFRLPDGKALVSVLE
jgi:predicted nucleic acid-binding protein